MEWDSRSKGGFVGHLGSIFHCRQDNVEDLELGMYNI